MFSKAYSIEVQFWCPIYYYYPSSEAVQLFAVLQHDVAQNSISPKASHPTSAGADHARTHARSHAGTNTSTLHGLSYAHTRTHAHTASQFKRLVEGWVQGLLDDFSALHGLVGKHVFWTQRHQHVGVTETCDKCQNKDSGAGCTTAIHTLRL